MRGVDARRLDGIMVGRIVKTVAVVTMVASFGVWVYAFSGAANRDSPDLLDDLAWAEQADMLCAEAAAEVDDMPSAVEAETPAERASQIDAANSRYRAMLATMQQLNPSTDRDAEMVREWQSDWELFLSDRDRYAQAIQEDPAASFTVTNTGGGERLYKRISRFANTNFMFSCIAPEDV